MAPEIFIKAYARATTEEYQMSEEAPKIDAKNPAGNKLTPTRASFSRIPSIFIVIVTFWQILLTTLEEF